MTEGGSYAIGELAAMGGVSRRTVRYYVQEGLIPPPSGLGRGSLYGPEHLEKLVRVKEMQERGLTLEAIRRELASDPARPRPGGGESPLAAVRSSWTRIEILPGVELHVSSRNQIPGPGKLEELREWCRRHIRPNKENDDA